MSDEAVALGEPETTGKPSCGRPLPVLYTIALAAVLVPVTLYGLISVDPYRLDADATAQGRGQDLLTLLAVPVLVWAAVRARAGSLRAHLLWLGIALYLVYTYVSYAFSIPFNAVFPGYVAVLGLSSYGLLNGLLRIDVTAVAPAFERTPRRAVAVLFAVSGGAFALLWLSDIVPALPDGQPTGRLVYDLPNPIYVLDLAWIIPLLIATAVQLWRGRPAGSVLGAVLLAKVLTLGLALLFMAGFVAAGSVGLDASDAPVVVLALVIVAVDAVLLVRGARRMGTVGGSWLRAGIWP